MRGKTIVEIIIESVNYVIINYALSNMALFFGGSILYVLFFASQCWLMRTYWGNLLAETNSKLLASILTVLCFCAHIGMVYFIGRVSGTLVRFTNV